MESTPCCCSALWYKSKERFFFQLNPLKTHNIPNSHPSSSSSSSPSASNLYPAIVPMPMCPF
ncbi:hypothetical protein PanWU01x14_098660 [Parasponia andersonii]|uniref:Uncharacterized protein n=1 Tax=Parasponia andersonii TaxID=3476 RepID=A0A2P5D432_PARAD|nr:hypothetical protein PanWU01x14_098660 [Parasponia andersonii]